jgi:predicted metal-dependent phosphoesterase TrpH
VIDLHTHSTCSDGTDPPEHIPELAAAAGCTAVALTDHDTLACIERARVRADELGIELVAGCEVSCLYQGVSAHVLVYFVEDGFGPLHEELGRLRDDRMARNHRLADRLEELGIPITYEAIVAEAAGEESAGRPHVAALLVRLGLAESIPDAFDRWLGEGQPAYIPKARVSPAEIASSARASGGVAVLAHPLTLGRALSELDDVAAGLATAGFAGLEAYYGRYSPEDRAELVALARRHDLVPTGGSDYHGEVKTGLRIGKGEGDLSVPDEVLTELRERRPRPRGSSAPDPFRRPPASTEASSTRRLRDPTSGCR